MARSRGKATKVTRQRLYEEIWRTSVKSVADAIGISSQRLTKICDRFNIPYPKPSQRASETPSHLRPPLPNKPRARQQTITITSATGGPFPARQVAPRSATSDGPYHREINAWLRADQQRLRQLDSNMSEDDRNRTSATIPPDVQRRLKILNRIFQAAQKSGLTPKLQSLRHLHFIYAGVPINCELRQTKALVTVEDVTGERREYRYTGKLLFKIETHAARDSAIKTEWHEKTVGPLEKRTDEIVQAIARVGPAAVQANAERLERQRQSEAERNETRRREQMERQSVKRRRALYRAAAHHRMARDVGELLFELERAPYSASTSVGDLSIFEWLQWAKAEAARLDPLSGGIVTFFKKIDHAAKPNR